MGVYFSKRASASFFNSINSYFGTEIGGVFLGQHINNNYYVIEHIDMGINCRSTNYHLSFDSDYIEHVANVIADLYELPLSLIGFWHSHPVNDKEFSLQDIAFNEKVVLNTKDSIISGIILFNNNIDITLYETDGKIIKCILKPSFEESKIPFELLNIKSVILNKG